MGYGGMIHKFKNFVLRNEPILADQVRQDISDIENTIEQYAALKINPAEHGALNGIRKILGAYGSALTTIERLEKGGSIPSEVDRVVKINDRPALDGLATLNQAALAESAVDAQAVTAALTRVTKLSWALSGTITGMVLFLAVAFLFLIRVQIVRPITSITEVMTQLAAGDLDVSIKSTDRTNELGDMARSVEVFKQTAIQRVRADERRIEHEERYRLILDGAADSIITISEDGTIVLFNPAAESMFGYSAEEAIGKNAKTLLITDFHESATNIIEALASGNEEGMGTTECEVSGSTRAENS